MATLYKRGRYWWCWGRDAKGVRWQRTTGQTDKRAATAAAIEIERSLATCATYRPKNAHTLGEALGAVLDNAIVFKRAEATIEFLSQKGRHLIRLFGEDQACEDITAADCAKYTETRLGEGASPHTVHKELRVLVQALRRAAKLGKYVPKVLPRDLRPDELEHVYDPRDRWLAPDDLEMLLGEFDPGRDLSRGGRPSSQDRRDYILMWCLTGARESELYRMKPADIDWHNAVWNCIVTKTPKTVVMKHIPLSPVAFEIVQRRKRLPQMFPRWDKVVLDLYRATLRIELKLNPGHAVAIRNAKGDPPPKKTRKAPPVCFDPVTPNDFRRTFASWLAQRGVPLFHAAKLMGHGSSQMLQRVYAQLDHGSLRDAVSALPTDIAGAPRAEPAAVIDLGERRWDGRRAERKRL